MKSLHQKSLFLFMLIVMPVRAEQYLNLQQAQQGLFAEADRFLAMPVVLTAAQKKKVETVAGVKLRFPEQPVWRAEKNGQLLGWFVLDEVYGKHEFITYAVSLDTAGAVKRVLILAYRETHGGEVRNANWLAQFMGKTAAMPLRLDEEIQYISGATLSSKHIVEGVRRVLAIYDVAIKQAE